MKEKILSILLTFVLFFSTLSPSLQIFADETQVYDGNSSITNLELTKTSLTEGVSSSVVGMNFQFDYSSPDASLKTGDQLTFSTNIGSVLDTDWESLPSYDVLEDGIVIGTIKITAAQIIFTVGINGNNKTNFTGNIDTGEKFNAKSGTGSESGSNYDVSVGEKSAAITIFKTISPSTGARAVDQTRLWKWGSSVNGKTQAAWQIAVNPIGLDKLYRNHGESMINNGIDYSLENVILEDTLSDNGAIIPSSVNILSVLSPIGVAGFDINGNWVPVNVSQQSIATGDYFAQESGSQWVSVKNGFQQIQQNSSESYEAFKARLTPLDWGIYTDSSGVTTFVANFGNLPGNGIKYSDYGFSLGDTLDSVAGNNNNIDGQILYYRVQYNTFYPGLSSGTHEVNNNASITSNKGTNTVSASATLSFGNSIGTASAGEILVGLFDEDSLAANPSDSSQWEPIPNALFKLQKEDSSGVWQDIPNNGTQIYTATTNNLGLLTLGALANGTYRITQVSTDDTHQLDGTFSTTADSVGSVTSIDNSIGEFTVATGQNTGFSTVITNSKRETPVAPGTVIVKYMNESGDSLSDPVTLSGAIGTAYISEAKSIDGYTLTATPENASGNYSNAEQTVTYVYKPTETPVGIRAVTVKYVDESGQDLADSITLSGTIGSDYVSEAKDIDGYTLTTTPENATGTFTDADQTVTYIYKKVETPVETGTVIVKYVDENGQSLTKDSSLSGNIGETYTSEAKEIDGYTLTATPENAAGKFTETEQTVTYIYKKVEAFASVNNSQKTLPKTSDTKNNQLVFIGLIVLSGTLIYYFSKKTFKKVKNTEK